MKINSFTLIEVVIAMSLFSILMLTGYWLIQIGFSYQNRFQELSSGEYNDIENYNRLKRTAFFSEDISDLELSRHFETINTSILLGNFSFHQNEITFEFLNHSIGQNGNFPRRYSINEDINHQLLNPNH